MHVTVFGAGGATGRLVVAKLVDLGHDVTAFVRTPGKLAVEAANLTIAQGDATDPAAVAEAVAGADAVVSAIGGTGLGRSTQITDCVTTIVAALSQANPAARLVAISTVGAGDSGKQMPLVARVFVTLALRNAIKDHNGAETAIQGSPLRWTIARCVGLTDDPARGEVQVSEHGGVRGSRISRADVAAWIVDNLEDETYVRRAVALS